MSTSNPVNPSTETDPTTGGITWDSREENLTQETYAREKRIQVAYKNIRKGLDSLMTSMRIMELPLCQLDIQLIERRLKDMNKQLELIKQQNVQLRQISNASSQLEAMRDRIGGNGS